MNQSNKYKIKYGRQEITQSDIDAVNEVLRSDWLTQGPAVPLFEKKVAEYCGASFSIATNSATSALHVACLALDLKKGDILWTCPNTFVASANAAIYCGASVDFVDCNEDTYNIDIQKLESKLRDAKKQGKLPKVVMPVHLTGQSCEMETIFNLSKKFGFKIIEDGSHAIGGEYKNEKVGSCKYSDITVFSFHPVKIITSGEGGMALTNNEGIYQKLKKFRSHGITSDSSEMEARPKNELWNYQQVCLGYNYRMTDISAALGISQLSRIDAYIKKRHVIAKKYNDELSDLPVKLPIQHPDTYSSYHLYVIRLLLDKLDKTHLKIHDEFIRAGINVNLHYVPVYRQPFYEKMGFKKGYCPESEKYHRTALSIPIYPTLKESEQDWVINMLKNIIN